MNEFFHICQWMVSIIGVGAICYLYWVAFQESKLLCLLAIFLSPLLLPYILVRYWNKYQLEGTLLLFVTMGVLAGCFQRARIGFWDWPDVDYQVAAVQPVAEVVTPADVHSPAKGIVPSLNHADFHGLHASRA